MDNCPLWCDKSKFKFLGGDYRLFRSSIYYYHCGQCGTYIKEEQDDNSEAFGISPTDDRKLAGLLLLQALLHRIAGTVPVKSERSVSPLQTAVNDWMKDKKAT